MSGDESELFSESIATQDGPHHSTPIKESPFKHPQRLGRITARVEPSSPVVRQVASDVLHTRPMASNRSLQHDGKNKSQASESANYTLTNRSLSSAENVTIQKQRREIQLLVQELRDRDNELNETVSAHSQQLLAWERDRQRLLTLEQKCARYEGEVQKKRKQLEVAMTKLKAARSQEESTTANISSTEQELHRLSVEKHHHAEQVDCLEKQNVSLNDSLKAMSGTLGQLQAREQELMTLLGLKEKEIERATSNMSELNLRIQQLDVRCKECQNREAETLHRATQWKQKYTQARTELEKLSGVIESKESKLWEQGKEMGQLHQQLVDFQEELVSTGDRERRKDDIIDSMRSKQDRTLAELRSVRELYERQQREITLMQLNLDNSKENSNQNSNLDQSIALDDSIVYQASQQDHQTSHQNPPADCQQVSFEDRLSSFLDEDTDTEAVGRVDASPATKLQRLLTESRMMIESLEKSTVPAAAAANVSARVQEVRPTNFTASPDTDINMLEQSLENLSPVRETSDPEEEQLHSPVQTSHEMIVRHMEEQSNKKFLQNGQHSGFLYDKVPRTLSDTSHSTFGEAEAADILRRQVDS